MLQPRLYQTSHGIFISHIYLYCLLKIHLNLILMRDELIFDVFVHNWIFLSPISRSLYTEYLTSG